MAVVGWPGAAIDDSLGWTKPCGRIVSCVVAAGNSIVAMRRYSRAARAFGACAVLPLVLPIDARSLACSGLVCLLCVV